MANHSVSVGLGDGSPLSKLYDQDALVLLIGVGHINNTSLHLAEHRASWPSKAEADNAAPMMIDGERQWVVYTELELDEADFDQIGAEFAGVTEGHVGSASSQLMKQRALVDFAVEWMTANR